MTAVADLGGRVGIVTGAGQGIGRAIAEGMAAAGAKVVVNDANEATAREVADSIVQHGGDAVACPIPIGSDAAGRDIVALACQHFGGLHLLVNNAGVGGDTPLVDLTEEQALRSITVNLLGPMLLAKYACRVMTEQRDGRIVNMTSRSGLRGKYGEPAYSATKAAMAGLTLTMSIEMAPYGVNVNAVAPAAWTPLLEQMPEPARSETIAKRTSNVLNRVAQPEDVVPTVLFLLSDHAQYLTGQLIEATGQQAALL